MEHASCRLESVVELDLSVPRKGAERFVASLAICVICICINVGLSRLVASFGLPLYVDCVGTVLAAMLGGFMPGVLVGYSTNIVLSIFDPISLYYAVVNVLIAIVAATANYEGWFKSVRRTILAIFAFALVGGGVSSALSWCLYGMTLGDGNSGPLAIQLHSLGVSPFVSQLAADVALDLADKSVVTVISLVMARFMPNPIRELFDFSLWQQQPLTRTERRSLRDSDTRIMSVQTKVILIMSTVMLTVAVATTWMSYVMFNNSMVDVQTIKAQGIAELVSNYVDPAKVDDFLEKGRKAEGFEEAEQELAQIRDSFHDVQYVYVYRILEDGCHVVLDPDTDDLPGSEPGSVVEFDEAFAPYLKDLLAGHPIEPVVSDETYGWLLTVYEPLQDSRGHTTCYVAVDIDMQDVMSEGFGFLARVASLFVAFFALVSVFVLWFAEYGVVLPINSIALVSRNLAFDEDDNRSSNTERLQELEIHTGDEIENLYQALIKTSEDTMHYIEDVREQSETIERMQENLIIVMADLVESRDKFTGDHVRKTAAYVQITLDEMRREGVYADQLTDEFVYDVVHSAPLHDIGKIVVSDTVLNKPGRLTAEEFKAMQNHTTAGREIIERAVSAVSEPSYLDEAKNLAEFHHEKWDGSGYPTGRAGTDIPLSARIMAVADVFDALVSKRSYKAGFPLEKAFAIIEEGVGTHFDPLVATAFLNVKDKAAAIARDYGDVED